MTFDPGLHERDTSDNAFYEWLLSDHPGARAERDNRPATTYQGKREGAAKSSPRSTRSTRLLIHPRRCGAWPKRWDRSWPGPRPAEAEFAETDEAYVARLRADFETYMRVSGPLDASDYKYPADLIGPFAADYPPPPSLRRMIPGSAAD